MDSIKTAYSVAYYRLLLLAKGGIIGDIMSVDATCTSLVDFDPTQDSQKSLYEWNSICAANPPAQYSAAVGQIPDHLSAHIDQAIS